ncbi:DUF448 domain-containing protein [Deinococcus sp.]|uniref:YlxR family protein n=1 Tax=Deinococcus sp. TaxID=47478 RepID=UPI0025DA4718|nr:DUF448 domain-containing protein [Deinococcus sp.]
MACRRRRPQGEFRRFIRSESGWTVVSKGASKGQAGRGAYVCADTPACWAEKRLKRAFGAQAEAISQSLQTTALKRTTDGSRLVPNTPAPHNPTPTTQ